MPALPVFRLFRVLLLGGIVALAGCSSTGNRFDTTDLRLLEPGYTTLEEASALLQGEPANIYRQLDGSATARWAHTASLLTDAIYFNQELWLAFDRYGHFERIVKSSNIPHANLYQDARRVDVPLSRYGYETPAVQGTVSLPQPAPVTPPQPQAVSHSAEPYPVGSVPGTEGPSTAATQPLLPRTSVSYPLGR